ncbi:MAG: SDR family oxidoreductase [Acidobacteriota bacterium]|nr:SDR family oxidoreductase [Acidobacteriota bacterium]
MELNGKVAVVTGGASGIGAATSRRFAAGGAKVVVADQNGADAQRVARDIGGLAVICNVGLESEVNSLVEQATDECGPIDIFFSNAGIAMGGDILDTPLGVWQEQWDVNLMAHVYAVRAVLPSMLERGEGYLLHTSSMAGILSSHGNLPYAVTKHGVVGLAEWLAFTYRHRGIRVSCLCPLGVRTPMFSGSSGGTWATDAAGPVKEPEEVADMVADAVEEERFLILTDPLAQEWMDGKTANIDRWVGGMNKLQRRIEEGGGR